MFARTFVVAGLVLLAAAVPQKRQKAEVIYSCTKPNNVALTFVRRQSFLPQCQH
jgi:hypothetical protein